MTTLHDLFPGRYLAGEDLGGQDAVVVIRRVEVEEMGRLDKKGETTQKPVVYFSGVDKGLVLNKTNAVSIAKMYGDVIEGWYGQAVTLYPKREHAFGSDWTVIRIRPRRPEQAPAPQRIGQRNGVNPATGELPSEETTDGDTIGHTLRQQYVDLYNKLAVLGIEPTKDGRALPPALPGGLTDARLTAAVDYLRALVVQAEDMSQPAEAAA